MRVLALLLIPWALWSCSLLRMRHTTDYSYPAVRSLAPIQDRLQAADTASPNVLLTDIGQVSTPGFEAPFWRVVYRPFQPGLKRVLVIAGVNGNGAAGVEYALGLVRELAAPPGRPRSTTRTSCLWPTRGAGSTVSAQAQTGSTSSGTSRILTPTNPGSLSGS